MKTINPAQAGDGIDLVRLWTLADGTRCTLATLGDGLEIRIRQGGAIVRRAPCVDVRHVRYVAEMWRVEHEMKHGPSHNAAAAVCPDCGDDAVLKRASPDKRWLSCGSCGNVWLEEADGQSRRAR